MPAILWGFSLFAEINTYLRLGIDMTWFPEDEMETICWW